MSLYKLKSMIYYSYTQLDSPVLQTYLYVQCIYLYV